MSWETQVVALAPIGQKVMFFFFHFFSLKKQMKGQESRFNDIIIVFVLVVRSMRTDSKNKKQKNEDAKGVLFTREELLEVY